MSDSIPGRDRHHPAHQGDHMVNDAVAKFNIPTVEWPRKPLSAPKSFQVPGLKGAPQPKAAAKRSGKSRKGRGQPNPGHWLQTEELSDY